MTKEHSRCAESCAASAACSEARGRRLINEEPSPLRHRDTEKFLNLGFADFRLSLCLCDSVVKEFFRKDRNGHPGSEQQTTPRASDLPSKRRRRARPLRRRGEKLAGGSARRQA